MKGDLIRLAVFILCGQLFILLRPKEGYEKYFKLMINLMILLQFLLPVITFLSKETDVEMREKVQVFLSGFESNVEDGDMVDKMLGETQDSGVEISSICIEEIEVKMEGEHEP